MTHHKDTLIQLHNNLNTLRERKDKYGGNAPLDLLNQISDHEQAITLTNQTIAGELSEAEWDEALRPLLVHIRDRGESRGDCRVSLGNVGGSIIGAILAGRDITAGGDMVTGTQYKAESITIYQPSSPAGAPPQRDKNLGILLNNVRKIWVEDYLNSALLNAIYIDLGLQEKRDAVPQPFEDLNIRLRWPEQAERDLPAGTRAHDVYQQAQGSLLILGQPGAGKTTLLATLTRDLLAQAETNPLAPVPAIFNLASWAAKQKPLAEWLEDELYQQYQVSRKLGRIWLAEERLALLLDGLDEVAEVRRKACVSAINTYRENYMGPLVVCSRLKDYEALQARLKLRQAIVLKTLIRPQVKRYFQRLEAQRTDSLVDGGLIALFERIWQDSDLRELTEIPLMLNIITVTYAYPQAPALPHGGGDNLRAQIFDAYSERMFNRPGRTVSLLHPPETTLRYLRYLAAQLQAHDLTQFSIGQIRGSWVPAGKIRRQYHWFSGLSVGLIFGLSVGLIFGLIFGLSVGLIFGLIGGLSIGLSVGRSDKDPTESLYWARRKALKVLGLTVLGGLGYGESIALLAEAGVILPAWLAWGLLGGLIGGLGGWLSRGLSRRFIFWLIAGLSVGLIFGLIFGLLGGLIGGLSIGLIFGLSGGVMRGLRRESVSHKIEPDQEVRRSRRSALLGGLSVGLSGGLIFGLIFGLLGGLIFGLFGGLIFGLLGGLIFGLLGGLGVGLTRGGDFLIQHYLRLFLLNRHNLLPFELILFLNQATDLIFLQRLGGSYRFIHRSVQEHFAAQWPGLEEE